jgi:hypothetical protein
MEYRRSATLVEGVKLTSGAREFLLSTRVTMDKSLPFEYRTGKWC